jgi:hypothetical protein
MKNTTRNNTATTTAPKTYRYVLDDDSGSVVAYICWRIDPSWCWWGGFTGVKGISPTFRNVVPTPSPESPPT